MTAQGVVVSGASTGIGLATVELLAKQGYVAFAGTRTAADADRLGKIHPNVRPIKLDVTDESSIQTAVRDVTSEGTPLLGVVSNAGVALGGPLELLPLDEIRRVFEVNVFGALRLVQAFLPFLPEKRGRVVFVGSVSGRLATPFIAPYSASKYALRAISDALRVELAPAGIAVSLIEPASAKTPIWEKGRARRDELIGLIDRPGARPYYRAAMERVLEILESEERDGMPVERVSEAILQALTAKKPREAHLVGTPARLGGILGMLPARFRARVMRSQMKLP